MIHSSFHKDFKLNGHSFASKEEILKYLEKESEPIYAFLRDWFFNNSTLEVKTSGSTGKPKSILLKKEHIVNSALATGKALDLKSKTSALLCLPIQYIAGKLMVIRALILGWDLHFTTPSSNPLEKINSNFDVTALVPLQLQNSIDKLHLFKKVIVGGGAVSSELEEKLQHTTSKVFATYGMTETITHIALKPLNHLKLKPSVYKVLADVTIYKDERNCLIIDAPKVADHIIFTNDVVQLVSDKEFYWLGRFDNVVNSGGVKLHPEVIEQKLSSKIKSRFFVSGIKDKTLGERLILIVEGNSRVIDTTNCDLSKFELPKEIHFLDLFVETSSGKIQRKETLKKLNLV